LSETLYWDSGFNEKPRLYLKATLEHKRAKYAVLGSDPSSFVEEAKVLGGHIILLILLQHFCPRPGHVTCSEPYF